MALTSLQIIEAICPSLYAASTRDTFISLATESLGAMYFGATAYPRAVALKAAHLFTIASRTLGTTGQVSALTEGKLSLSFFSFGGASSSSADLSQTSYGVQLKEMMHGVAAVGMFDFMA